MPTKAQIEAERDALKADLAIIAERIRTEAIDRSWCSEYDDIMGEINSQTSAPHMKPRVETKTLVLSGTILVPFSDLHLENVQIVNGEPDADDVQRLVRSWAIDEVTRETYALDTPRLEGVTILTTEQRS